MSQYVQLPDGGYFPLKEGEDPQSALREAEKLYPQAFGIFKKKEAVAPPQSGFLPAAKAGIASLKSDIAALAGRTGLMDEAAAEKYIQEQEAYKQKTFKPTETFGEAPLTKTAELFGGSLPYMAAPVAAGLGALAAPSAAIVAPIAAGLTSAAQFTGSNLSRQMDEGKKLGETELGSAAVAAVPQAALDILAFKLLPGISRIFSAAGKEVPEQVLAQATKQNLGKVLQDYTLATGKGAGVEGLTEAGQQVLERLQAGLSITDEKARDEYFDSFIGGAVLGGALSPAGRYVERGQEASQREAARVAEQKRLADEAEAAKNQPDALMALDAKYNGLLQQKQALEAAAVKPKKGATPEEKQAYKEAKQAISKFNEENNFFAVRSEYEKRKDAIAALKAQQAPEAAPEAQPTLEAQPPAPPAPSEQFTGNEDFFTTTDDPALLNRMMDAYDSLKLQEDQLAEQMAQSPEKYEELRPKQKQIQEWLATLTSRIEARGGTTVKPAEFEADATAKINALEKQIEAQKAALAKATDPNQRDYEAADKALAKLKELNTEREKTNADIEMRRKALAEKQANLTERGQTRPLFTEAEAPIPVAEKPEEALSVPSTAKLETTQVSNVAPTAEEKATAASKKAYDLGEQLREAEASLAPMQKMAASSRDQSTYLSAVAKVADLRNQLSSLQNVKPERLDTKSLDLFGEENVIRTALRNGDQRTIDRIQAEKEKIKLGQLDEEKAKRDALVKSLDERLDLTGKKVTRTVTPEEYDRIMADIETEKRKVEMPQRNAKKALLQEIHDLADEHAALTAQMESGIATPTMREKVAGVQAKLGKGEAPAERPMNAGEKYQLQRKIDAIVKRYNAKLGQIKPIREKIEALYKSMYKVEEAKAASVVEGEKRTIEDMRALSVRGKSKQAATAARINRGDVRKEAETSEKMRSLAAELGREDPRYIQLVKETQRRIKAQIEKYGKGDPDVAKYQNDAFKMLQEKALQFGKETPEYKATLKEQIAYFQETLGKGKQEVKSLRGVQETRKVQRAAKEERTGSPESREATEKRQESARERYLRQYQLDMEEARRFDEQAREARGVEIESPDLTKTQVTALENNDVRGALSDLANDTKADPVNRAVASRLAEVLDETDVKLHNKLTNDKGEEILGQATSRVLELSRSGGLSQEILLHEGTHSAAERVIQVFDKNPELLTEQQRAAVRELKAIFEVVKKDKTITSINAKSSLSEFVAEVMSNINLQKQLKEKPWKLKEMWTGFKSAILRMLGLKVGDVNDMLRASLMSVDAIFTPTSMEIKGAERPAKGEARGERKLSQKDIAALHDGSNSMKQFADQFGDFIKQKDRTPEDVERIAADYLGHMASEPTSHIAVPYLPDDLFKKYDKKPELLTKEQKALVEKYRKLQDINSADSVREAEKMLLDLTSLDYKAPTIMSDGKVYNENNPLHYVEASVETFAALKAQEDEYVRNKEVRDIRDKRVKDLRSLLDLLSSNPSYTLAENALVAKAAAKYAVLSDKTGRLKLAEIAPNNRHNVAVVSLEAADAVIRELRAGKNLKQAFLEGLQKNADQAAKDNQRKDGWQKFEQSSEVGVEPIRIASLAKPVKKDGTKQKPIRVLKVTANQERIISKENKRRSLVGEPLLETKTDIDPTIDFLEAYYKQLEARGVEDAAIKLNKGAAGTPWCTGASESTARSQIERGDFYIYYKQGRPEVAVRMDGQNKIGEVRGNSPNQALNKEQQEIAENFLRGSQFVGADRYLQQFSNKQRAIELAKDGGSFTPKELFDNNVVSGGTLDRRAVDKLLDFRVVDGYSIRPDATKKVQDFFENKLHEAVKKAYEDGYYIGKELTFSAEHGADNKISIDTFSFDGKDYTPSLEKIKGAQEITVHNATNFELPNLEMVQKISVFGGRRGEPLDASFPKVKNVEKITTFNHKPDGSIVTLAPGAVVDEVRSADALGYLTIKNAIEVKEVEALGFGKNQIVLTLPDALYVPEPAYSFSTTRKFRNEMADAVVKQYEEKLDRANLDEFKNEDAWMDEDANAEDSVRAQFITDKFIEDHLAAVKKELTDEQYVKYDDNKDLNEAIEHEGPRSVEYTLRASFDALAEIVGHKEAVQLFSKATGMPVDLPEDTKIIAPNKIADRPPTETLTETPETPRYAPKNVGVQTDEKGRSFFRTKQEPGSAIFARQKGVVDTFLGNLMGLPGRVQYIDRFAALSDVLKKGQTKGQITSQEALNAEWLLRFGEQRSMYAGQFLTNGRVALVKTQTPEGTAYTYESKKGVSMMDVAEALSKGKFENDTKAEDALTIYEAGARANQVGWDKLNFESAAEARAEYNALMAQLAANPEQKNAVEEASKLYRQYNAGLLDFLVETGAISKDKAAELKAVSYVPFYRVANSGDVQLMVDKEHPFRIGNIKDEPQLQALVGGNEYIMPIFTSSVQNTFMLTNMGLRNQSVKETAYALRKIGMASRVSEGKGPASNSVVRFKNKGKDYYALIDTEMYGIPADLVVKGMEGIKTTIPAVVNLMGIPADILRTFVTRNPAYALRQVVRDPLTAWFTTGTDAAPVLSSFKELAKMVAGRSEVEKELMAAGAISSNVFSGDQRDMTKFLKDMSAGKSGWDKAMGRLDALALQGDAATRAVIYKDSLDKGMTKQQALLRTLESMNFSRRGLSPSMQMLSVLIPFFNAQIQGLDVLYRAFKGNMPFSEQLKIRQKLVARGVMLAAGTITYAMLMEDDEAYKRAKPEERLANWFVYVPGIDEPVRVPIPFELGYLFKALPEALYTIAASDEKASKSLEGMGKLLAMSNPFALPQAIKPLTEAYLGKSFFSGDIESEREKKTMMPTERYRETTTEVSKLLGQVTGKVGVSPITLDYLMRGYTGPLGIAIVQLANPILNTEAEAAIAKPSMKASKLPFIGGIFQPVEGRGTLDEAYAAMVEIQQIKGTYNRLVSEGRRAEANAFAQEYATKLSMASTSGFVQKQLGVFAAQERKIIAHPTMSQEEKDRRLEQLDKAKLTYARRFIAAADRTTPQ